MNKDDIKDICKLSKEMAEMISKVKWIIYGFTEGQIQLTDKLRAMLAFNTGMNLLCQILVDYKGSEDFESLFNQTIDNLVTWKEHYMASEKKTTLN